ncbi:MAG: hypothetical protein KAT28_05190 [Candidatus Aenigmarchaeota archaeon]|nr:hypothetical protein [Candidatus Aenigmarchaeota archaeon]
MDIKFEDNKVIFDKILSDLDKFVLETLEFMDFKYVIVSGYIPILFGRSRGTEDVDIIIEKMSYENFFGFYEKLTKSGYWFLNSENPKELFEMLEEGDSIRLAKRDIVIPNIELKFPKNKYDNYSLQNSRIVIIDSNQLRISSLEIQIPYKFYLGSEKDIEDALYLYDLFSDKLDKSILLNFCKDFGIELKKYGLQ